MSSSFNNLTRKALDPYVGGFFSGIVLVGSVWFTGKYFGASTTFVRAVGGLESVVDPEYVKSLTYFINVPPVVDWQGLFLVGIFLGSLIGALSSGTFRWAALPERWEKRFGPSIWKRGIVSFCGGLIAVFGARLAGGCPSGHGLSGLAQLAVSSFISLVCFFIGGVFVARLLYKR